MDTAHGPTAPALSRLSQGIREYSLFQAVQRVIEHLRMTQSEASGTVDEEALYDRIEFHANSSLGFPSSDIHGVEFFEEHGTLRARLCLNVISLLGAGSPLPAFYGEQALGDGKPGRATRQFLDLFHHRLQRLLLPIWRKYRYHTRFRSGATDPFSERLFALIGLGEARLRDAEALEWKRLLPYLGLLSLRAHSAALIEAVLRYYFKHAELFIEQCIERQADILDEQLNRLGRSNSDLGQDLVLGTRVRDRGGKFRVHVRSLDWQRFHDFLPIGHHFPALCALVRFTLRDPLAYDLRLQLRRDAIRELRIGDRNPCRLGWTSWLGHGRADGIVALASRHE